MRSLSFGPPERIKQQLGQLAIVIKKPAIFHRPSGLDQPPLDLGRMLQPLGSREPWYDDMLEGRI